MKHNVVPYSYDSIICVAGAFDVGSIKDKDVFEKFEKIDKMNFQSALLTGHLATKFLNEQGFLMLTGAAGPFLGPMNFAFPYAMSKQTTHALALHLAEREDIPKSSSVCCILP